MKTNGNFVPEANENEKLLMRRFKHYQGKWEEEEAQKDTLESY